MIELSPAIAEPTTEPRMPALESSGRICSVEGCEQPASESCWVPGCAKLLCIQHAKVRNVFGQGWLVCPEHARGKT